MLPNRSAEPGSSPWAQRLARNLPSIDVRSPGEFAQGHLPGAINLPILDDAERARVGTVYRLEGPDAARALGFQLVAGEVKESRIAAWTTFLDAHPEAYLYCWRGGARSGIAAQWLAARGYTPPRVEGGYKTLRQLCLDALDVPPDVTADWWLLGGRTGSGKTVLLRQLAHHLDLEALAEHRGSAFGATLHPQPALPTFENRVACALLARTTNALVLEDESRTIGRLGIPEAVHRAMQRAPVVILEADLSDRVAAIQREYVELPLATMTPEQVERRFLSALARIQRRLGGLRFRDLSSEIQQAFVTGEHHRWIERLLTWYYDPMYDYQLEQKQARIRFAGPADAVRSFLETQRRYPSAFTTVTQQ